MTTKKKWRLIVGLVLTVVVLFAAYYAYSMFSFVSAINTNHPFSTGNQPLNTAKWEGTERVNILLMGVDRRDPNDRPRSDTILLASIDPNTKKVSLYSIMRDSYVQIPGVGKSKINAAFANGGPELMIDTVQQYLQIPIHYYVATDFEGFAKIIDALGGVDVNVKEDMNHPDDGIYDINLKKGQQHLDGQHALMYVRYRGTPRADFDRTERQREMGQLVMQKMKSPAMLLKLPSLLKTVTPYMQSNLSTDVLYKLATLGLSKDAGSMQTAQIPPDNMYQDATLSDGEMVLEPDLDAVHQYVKEQFTNTGTATTTQQQGNGAGTSGGNDTSTQQGQGQQQNQAPQQNLQPQPAQNQDQNQNQNQGGQRATVTGEYVNVRQKPGTDYPVIGQVYKGAIVTIEGTDGDWDYVRTQDGMMGYIKASLLTVQ